jgi:hypothetical protein
VLCRPEIDTPNNLSTAAIIPPLSRGRRGRRCLRRESGGCRLAEVQHADGAGQILRGAVRLLHEGEDAETAVDQAALLALLRDSGFTRQALRSLAGLSPENLRLAEVNSPRMPLPGGRSALSGPHVRLRNGRPSPERRIGLAGDVTGRFGASARRGLRGGLRSADHGRRCCPLSASRTNLKMPRSRHG